MLSENMIKRLNEQLNLELYSANVYLQMSAWADNNGFEGASKFLKAHAAEEMQHMYRLFDYLNETGALAEIGAVAAPRSCYAGLKEVFEEVYKHEKDITVKINELVEKTLSEKDFSSFNFLQWYVAEQHEEERLFKSILDKINLIGDNGNGLFHVDKELAALAAAK
ncbi:non-heme ferritin [Neisseria wadsworthii]|uniref:non-heme ferritin n=1 Tax=Neisseria wadsworthii TaxID=607711 RepID=UPI000D3056D9|nr:non-heme ferritin [Neisseria wadsworthii]